MKKIKSMLVALLAILSVNSFADDAVIMHRLIGNVMYEYNKSEIIPATETTDATPADGTEAKPYSATVVGLKGANVTTAVFPDEVNFQNDLGDNVYLKVTDIGANWMDANATLGTVDVKEVLTDLSINGANMEASSFSNAFKTLKALETLTVEGPFFRNIESLTSNRMDAGNKASLKILDLSGLTITENINDNAFADFEALETIVLPPNLKTIGANAFKGTALTAITIPEKVTTIGDYAFADLETLTSADLSGAAALTTIGKYAFSKTGITSVVIPATVTYIGTRAFQSNEDLTTVTINAEELTTIPSFCFQGSGITAITLPDALTTIEKNAFYGTALATIDIPETVTSIGQRAFQKCESLATVTGMEGITVINDYTFAGCTALTSIALSEEITEVGKFAFSGTQIATLNLPNCESFDATALGKDASDRAENDKLATVTLGACDIDSYTFANCTALTTVTWDGIPAPETVEPVEPGDGDDQQGTIDGDEPTAPAPELGIENRVNRVAQNAFYGCTGLTNFNYLNGDDDAETEVGAANVDDNAFIGCTQFVNFNTSLNYVIAAGGEDAAPLNTKFVYTMPEPPAPEMITLKPVKDKTGSKYFQKFNNPKTIKVGEDVIDNTTYYEIDPDAVDGVYSIYVDEGIAYFQSLRRLQGKYVVAPGDCVILKASTDDDIELTVTGNNRSSSFVDEVFCLGEEISLAAFQTNVLNANYVSNYGQLYGDQERTNDIKEAGYPANYMSIWRLTNTTTDGFGFTRYTGSTLKADQFFILVDSRTVPAEARLQNIFIDEDGNVENDSDVTAIKQFEAAKTEDGAIYNLQGVRVNKAGKGIFIQNGKKFVK